MNITKPLNNSLTWAASSRVSERLPKDLIITEIELQVYLTASGAAAAALDVMGLWRLIQGLEIVGGSGRQYFSNTGSIRGVLMHYLNMVDHPGTTWRDIVATSQYFKFRLHFGSRPRDVWGRHNPYDLTVAIPAHKESSLDIVWVTGAADDTIDDILTVSSGSMKVLIHGVTADALGEAAWIAKGAMVPISSSESYDPGATKSNYSGQRDIPTGNFVRRIAIMAIDATAGSSNGPILVADQMTQVGVFLGRENRWIYQNDAKNIELSNPIMDGMQVVDTPNTLSPHNTTGGLYQIDLRGFDHPDFGLDARSYPGHPISTSDIKLGMTIGAYASGETEQIWYDQVQQYQG